jgi:hypothetical protein
VNVLATVLIKNDGKKSTVQSHPTRFPEYASYRVIGDRRGLKKGSAHLANNISRKSTDGARELATLHNERGGRSEAAVLAIPVPTGFAGGRQQLYVSWLDSTYLIASWSALLKLDMLLNV